MYDIDDRLTADAQQRGTLGTRVRIRRCRTALDAASGTEASGGWSLFAASRRWRTDTWPLVRSRAWR